MWKFNSESPIYNQIMEQVEGKILSGEFKPGGRFPSVREFAAEAGVNPNTMQKAMVELEKKGLISTLRNTGRIVTEDEDLINVLRKNKAESIVRECILKLELIGLSEEEIRLMLKKNM